MSTLFDTSVLLATMDKGEPHYVWSQLQLERRRPIFIPDIVYCEFSVGKNSQQEVDEILTSLAIERLPGNDAILFRAGKAFKQYRDQHRGPKTSILPDFLIGAAAEVAGLPLVTADLRRFGTYFPQVKLIRP